MMNAEYLALKRNLARGWNTWNVRSVLSHVLLPQGLALNLAVKEYAGGGYLKESLIGRQGKDDEQIHPGLRTYDGRYTELTLRWKDITLLVQTGLDGDDWVMLVTPTTNQFRKCTLVLEAGFLWNRPGRVERDGAYLVAHCAETTVRIHTTGTMVEDPNIAAQAAYLAVASEGPMAFSTGRARSITQVADVLTRQKAELLTARAHAGKLSDVYAATQTCLAWDTIYEPAENRVVSPVSRIWSVGSGGYVLFCWDTYFAGYIAAVENKPLAYANVIEITRQRTPQGFVPNFINGTGFKSLDRSQPCVGSWVVRELYRRFRDRWLLEMLFDDLLAWNRWWEQHRQIDGLLAWGSDPYQPVTGNRWETDGVNDRFGAALESGLDNSPMYDDMPFDRSRHLMQLHDVGLNSLYVMDCEALADIAGVLNRPAEEKELRQRAAAFRTALAGFWDEDFGLFLNRRTDTGAPSRRISPTNFYPLLAGAATPAQAQRMMAEHFYNPAEFWGKYVLPSIARNDPAYPEQDYWRGRIWAPMNFLVYLGLRRYRLVQPCADLAGRSVELLLSEWRAHGHVHENYSGDTGLGCDKPNSDRFYHWGGLLGTIGLLEAGHYPPPEEPL